MKGRYYLQDNGKVCEVNGLIGERLQVKGCFDIFLDVRELY